MKEGPFFVLGNRFVLLIDDRLKSPVMRKEQILTNCCRADTDQLRLRPPRAGAQGGYGKLAMKASKRPHCFHRLHPTALLSRLRGIPERSLFDISDLINLRMCNARNCLLHAKRVAAQH